MAVGVNLIVNGGTVRRESDVSNDGVCWERNGKSFVLVNSDLDAIKFAGDSIISGGYSEFSAEASVFLPTPQEPSPTPTPSDTESPSTPTETPTPSPTETPTTTPTPTESPSPTQTPTPSPTKTPDPTPTTPEPTETPTSTPQPTTSPTASATPTSPSTPSPSPTPTASPTSPITPTPEITELIIPTEITPAQLAEIDLTEVVATELTIEQVTALEEAALETFETATPGSPEYEQALDALFVVAQADDIVLDEELVAVPVLGAVASGLVDAVNFIGNVGIDMSPQVRAQSEKIVVSAIVVGQITQLATATSLSVIRR